MSIFGRYVIGDLRSFISQSKYYEFIIKPIFKGPALRLNPLSAGDEAAGIFKSSCKKYLSCHIQQYSCKSYHTNLKQYFL